MVLDTERHDNVITSLYHFTCNKHNFIGGTHLVYSGCAYSFLCVHGILLAMFKKLYEVTD